MKIIFEKQDIDELHIVLRKCIRDKQVNQLMSMLQNYYYMIQGMTETEQIMVNVNDIMYVESNERKVFFYTIDKYYTSPKRIYQLQEELKDKGFIQINKSTLVNVDYISRLKALPNSKVLLTLPNGEKIEVSRTYIPFIKKYLKEVK